MVFLPGRYFFERGYAVIRHKKVCSTVKTVTINTVHNGIKCEDAIFKFTGGKLTIQSENGSWGLDRLDIADSTTFMCGNSEETSFEIESPFSAENIIEQVYSLK